MFANISTKLQKTYRQFEDFLFSPSFINKIFLATAVILAFLIRYAALDFQSADYSNFLRGWYNYIVEHDGFLALKDNFANYTPPYLYLLAWTTYWPVSSLVAIKLISFFFDLVLAILAYQLVDFIFKIKQNLRSENFTSPIQANTNQPETHNVQKLFNPQSNQNTFQLELKPDRWQNFAKKTLSETFSVNQPILAFLAILFGPTVIFNGAVWAQCDVIYTTFLVAAFLAVLKSRYLTSFIWLGVALSLKLQAVFLLPIFLLLILLRRVNVLALAILPAVYLIMIWPSFALGRDLVELLRIYLDQGNTYHSLSMNSPNFYQWWGSGNYEILAKVGLLVGATNVLGICYIFWLRRGVFAKCSNKTQLSVNQSLASLESTIQPNSNFLPRETVNPELSNHIEINQLTKQELEAKNQQENKIIHPPKNNFINRFWTKLKDKNRTTLNAQTAYQITEFWFDLALLSSLSIPYFLPKMHERYFFVADVISILYAFWKPSQFWLAIVINLVSFFAYGPYLLGTKAFDFSLLSLVLLGLICYLLAGNIRKITR